MVHTHGYTPVDPLRKVGQAILEVMVCNLHDVFTAGDKQ